MTTHKVISRRDLTDSVYVLRFERKGIDFLPGQHINVGPEGEDNRPYSIYSSLYDDCLEVLIKKVNNGNISSRLGKLVPGNYVTIDEPHGSFTINTEGLNGRSFWFIATGTGISPFHSIYLSYRELHFRIIHGVRYSYEAYENIVYGSKYMCCTSRDHTGDYKGRVTDYLKNGVIDETAVYMICGSYDMLDEVVDILLIRGISKQQIKTEGYF